MIMMIIMEILIIKPSEVTRGSNEIVIVKVLCELVNPDVSSCHLRFWHFKTLVGSETGKRNYISEYNTCELSAHTGTYKQVLSFLAAP